MSGDYDFFATQRPSAPALGAAGSATATTAPPSAAPRRSRALVALVVTAVLAAAVVVVVLVARPHPHDLRPVTLPAALGGLAPSRTQFAEEPGFASMAQPRYGDAPWAGRSYGDVRTDRVQANVLVARTDGDDLPDLSMGRDPWTAYGEVRCTRSLHVELAGLPDVQESPRMVLCARQRATLTVTVLAMTDDAAGYEPAAARLVDEAWAAVQ